MRLERETLKLHARAIETIPKPRVTEREREFWELKNESEREREMVSITLESFFKASE
jgi:hypothetical protein